MSKLWGGRFEKNTNELVEQFTASIAFDCELARDDILGSIAHAKMLGKTGIVSPEESASIVAGLVALWGRAERGDLPLSPKDEDVHMNLERLLTEAIGPVAGKLHTARSRNDQVALDLRLYLRRRIVETVHGITGVQDALLEQARRHHDLIIPGYTHVQRAQPVLLAHHLLAYFWMLHRDAGRLIGSWQRVNSLPLGAGALAGTTFPIDRRYVQSLLRFDDVTENSLDTVSDRDPVMEFLADASILMVHLSRLSEEFVLWSTTEFGFIELDDGFTTGSSMMPQKKNPDVAELVRGKSGRVVGSLMSVLTMMKGLPLTYNRDMQEDKEQLFDAADTVVSSLEVYAPMIRTMKVRTENLERAFREDYSNATDFADYLVRKGLAFREAHEVVGKVVRKALSIRKPLLELSLEEYREFSPLVEADLFDALKPVTVVGARRAEGGTAPMAVAAQLERADMTLAMSKAWVETKRPAISLTPADLSREGR